VPSYHTKVLDLHTSLELSGDSQRAGYLFETPSCFPPICTSPILKSHPLCLSFLESSLILDQPQASGETNLQRLVSQVQPHDQFPQRLWVIPDKSRSRFTSRISYQVATVSSLIRPSLPRLPQKSRRTKVDDQGEIATVMNQLLLPESSIDGALTSG
jgi:hypothetical protein